MFRLTTVTKNLLIINVLMFVATWVFSRQGVYLDRLLGLNFFLTSNFKIYQFVTYMFMHGNIEHIFFNMFALWMFGCVVENVLGSKRFLLYYFVCGIGAGFIQEITQFVSLYFFADTLTAINIINGCTVGASGAIYGVLLAFGMLFPNERIFIFPLPVPIKAKWLVMFYIVLELFMAINTSKDGVAHFAHLGGMLFGWLLIRYWRNHHGGNGYGRSKGQQFFDNLKRNWEQRSHKKADNTQQNDQQRRESDWDYNARKKADMDEIDRILDKVRRSGYDSLTEEEKKKLFDGNDR